MVERVVDVTDLPYDVSILIILYLDPVDCIRTRRVSRKWQLAFAANELTRHISLQHYPRALEVRQNDIAIPWASVLSKVAPRYNYLNAGEPRCTGKLALESYFGTFGTAWFGYEPVETGYHRLRCEDGFTQSYCPDPPWTYDGGWLVFPSKELGGYALYDLDSGKMT
ncbi:MAG: hypothetical protein M1818_001495 [Claussenomyces sp. TS43310]|nr:MAG: hypothetical protein M1818_001495 [Claussenomyces sp. TS43310]